MHENEGFRHLPSEESLIKVKESLRKRFKVREREREVLGGEKPLEIEQNEFEIALTLFIRAQ